MKTVLLFSISRILFRMFKVIFQSSSISIRLTDTFIDFNSMSTNRELFFALAFRKPVNCTLIFTCFVYFLLRLCFLCMRFSQIWIFWNWCLWPLDDTYNQVQSEYGSNGYDKVLNTVSHCDCQWEYMLNWRSLTFPPLLADLIS